MIAGKNENSITTAVVIEFQEENEQINQSNKIFTVTISYPPKVKSKKLY